MTSAELNFWTSSKWLGTDVQLRFILTSPLVLKPWSSSEKTSEVRLREVLTLPVGLTRDSDVASDVLDGFFGGEEEVESLCRLNTLGSV